MLDTMVEEPGFEPETADPKARAFPIKLLPRYRLGSGRVQAFAIGLGEQGLKLLEELLRFLVPSLSNPVGAPDVVEVQRRHQQPRPPR